MEVLRRKVLNVAVDEINERSKINLTVELLRRDSDKRKVTHFKFRWGNNKIVEDTKKTQNSLFE
jgi:plasmid replication initiation protein